MPCSAIPNRCTGRRTTNGISRGLPARVIAVAKTLHVHRLQALATASATLHHFFVGVLTLSAATSSGPTTVARSFASETMPSSLAAGVFFDRAFSKLTRQLSNSFSMSSNCCFMDLGTRLVPLSFPLADRSWVRSCCTEPSVDNAFLFSF